MTYTNYSRTSSGWAISVDHDAPPARRWRAVHPEFGERFFAEHGKILEFTVEHMVRRFVEMMGGRQPDEEIGAAYPIVKDRTTPRPSLIGVDDIRATELMVAWFWENYENPAERTPYESAEGGYQFIWGVVDAREEIEDRFPDASEAAREAAIDEITEDGDEWVPVPHPSDYE